MTKVRAALLGCGGMGAGLIHAAASLDICTVTCVADPQEELARKLAADLGCEFSTDASAVIARPDVDAVFIAAPNYLHPALTIEAARAGKHIFCEKPFCLQTEDGKAMVKAAQDAGVKLMVGQVLRYIPPFVFIWDLIKTGELGTPFYAQITRIGGPWRESGYTQGWRLRKDQCGGPLFEINAHEIDFMRTIMSSNVRRVFAVLQHHVDPDIDYEDTASVMMQFENGGSGTLLAGHSARLGSYDGKFYLTDGSIYFDNKTSLVTYKKGDAEPVKLAYAEAAANYPEDGVHREVREFVEAVAADTPVTIPGTEGLQNSMVAIAARISSETGQAVDLPL